MNINLNNSIIVLDEAHNIEDICRSVAGGEFREDYLAAHVYELNSFAMRKNQPCAYAYRKAAEILEILIGFIKGMEVTKAVIYHRYNINIYIYFSLI